MVIGSLLEKAGIQCAQSRRVHGSHPLNKCLFPVLKVVQRRAPGAPTSLRIIVTVHVLLKKSQKLDVHVVLGSKFFQRWSVFGHVAISTYSAMLLAFGVHAPYSEGFNNFFAQEIAMSARTSILCTSLV